MLCPFGRHPTNFRNQEKVRGFEGVDVRLMKCSCVQCGAGVCTWEGMCVRVGGGGGAPSFADPLISGSHVLHRQLWIAEQKEKARVDREAEKVAELRKSLDVASQQELIRASKGDPRAIRNLESHPLHFM